MKLLLRFGIVGLLGTTLVCAESIPWSNQKSEASSAAPQSRSENESSADHDSRFNTPIESTQEVFKVCSETNPPHCLKWCSKRNPPPCIKPPHSVSHPEPEFAIEARKEHYRGVVTLTMVVGTDGRVTNIRVGGQANMKVDENVLEENFKKWKFRPATYYGKPVPVEISLELNFH